MEQVYGTADVETKGAANRRIIESVRREAAPAKLGRPRVGLVVSRVASLRAHRRSWAEIIHRA